MKHWFLLTVGLIIVLVAIIAYFTFLHKNNSVSNLNNVVSSVSEQIPLTQTPVTNATLQISGTPQIVFNWNTDHCNTLLNEQPLDATDVSDQPAFAYHLSDRTVALLASNHDNLIMRGSSLDNVKRICETLHHSDHNGDPALFTDNQWIEGVEPLFNNSGSLTGDAVAFVHDEYHGYEHTSTSLNPIPQKYGMNLTTCVQSRKAHQPDYCWYTSTTYLLSQDGGATFIQPTPPSNLIIAPPVEFSPSIPHLGRSDPVVVHNPKDRMIYAFVMHILKNPNSNPVGGRCLLRSPDTDGKHWQMWNGAQFVNVTGSPYESAGGITSDCGLVPSLTNVWSIKYIPSFGSFVAVEQGGTSVLYTFSSDLLHWTTPQTLIKNGTLFSTWKPGDPVPTYYYSILDPGSTAADFGTIGTTPYLYYVQWHIKNGVLQNSERDVYRVPLKITPESNTSPPMNAEVYFVSPTGSDSNNGLSPSTPFLTLEKARNTMETSSIKTTYLMGGIYNRTAPLTLNQTPDAGESWLGYPGQVAILDGGNSVSDAIHDHSSSNVTIRWLTIENYAQNAIFTQNVSNVWIDSNIIKNIMSTGWNEGGIVLMDNFINGKVTHNYIDNSQYAGIIAANGITENKNNLLIDSNAVYHTCTKVADCGAIYSYDPSQSSRNVVISNNVIGQYNISGTPILINGGTTLASKGIYLDDLMSNTTVKNNIVYGAGTYNLQIHGGDHNIIENNIFDVSSVNNLAIYAQVKGGLGTMNDNTFTCNIVYSTGHGPKSLWFLLGKGILPAVSNNLYWSTVGTLLNTGQIIDSQPSVADPGFINPSAGNYGFKSGSAPNFCNNFQPINMSQVGPLPNN